MNSPICKFQSCSEGEIENTPKKKGRPGIHPIKSTPKSTSVDTGLRERMRQVYRCLIDFVMDDGHQPIQVFMEKPCKKLYPDYYRVISEPIDIITINSNIKNNRQPCLFGSTLKLHKQLLPSDIRPRKSCLTTCA